ncbi:MAG: hypothetical protein E3K37_04510 [Candidatus Kuenenia sp.]|nr:hypothetical protein [Candidatus Kuenenia hertensis]
MKRYIFVILAIGFQLCIMTSLLAESTPEASKVTFLVDEKCSKCHTIKRVFIHARTEEEWRSVIRKMMDKVPEWIKEDDAKQIFHEIVTHWQERVQNMVAEKKDYDDNRLLFIDRCTMCHTVNRILKHNKSPDEWRETVERMRLEAGDEYITNEDADRIATFLSKRSEMLKEDVASELFVTKCLVCHPPGEKILLEQHNRKEWEDIVRDRQQYARNSTQMIIIGNEETKLIVELLVKTQKINADKNSP